MLHDESQSDGDFMMKRPWSKVVHLGKLLTLLPSLRPSMTPSFVRSKRKERCLV